MTATHRVLIVDDNPAIHADFVKLLAPASRGELSDDFTTMAAALFDEPCSTPPINDCMFELAHAHQGTAAIELVRAAREVGKPFAAAYVDMRMPPGIDGLETIERIWAIDPDVQVVVCSAYSDYRWADIRARLGVRDNLLVIKKPFEPIEIVQSAYALTAKWSLGRENRAQLAALQVSIARAQKLEAIGRLAAGISHEINSPLQYVTSSLSYLHELIDDVTNGIDVPDLFTHAMPEALNNIALGVSKITEIAGAMRTLSHPGTGARASTDLNTVLEGALTLTRPTYNRVAEIAIELAPLPRIACHASEIGQVFVNLIVNAAHAMESQRPKRGRLRVASRVRSEAREIEIAISDTGGGIPLDVQGRIFEPFFTTKEVGQGTGQGLAISRAVIVDHHAGSLTFETVPGAGTTFYVRLPLPTAA